MEIIPSNPVAYKGGSGTFTVKSIVGELSATTNNLFIHNLSVAQDGDSATVSFSVTSVGNTLSSGVITLADGDTTKQVTVTFNQFIETLTGEDVFARQQQLCSNQNVLFSEINNLQLLIATSLVGQLASLGTTLGTVLTKLSDISTEINQLGLSTLNIIG